MKTEFYSIESMWLQSLLKNIQQKYEYVFYLYIKHIDIIHMYYIYYTHIIYIHI